MTTDNSLSELPKGWVWTTINEVNVLVTKGSTPTTYGFNYVASGINFIKVENISNGKILKKSITEFITPEAHAFLKRSQLKENDILFSIAGTIGRVGRVDKSDLPANTNQAVAIIRCPWNLIYHPYLMCVLDSPMTKMLLQSKPRGIGMGNVSLGDVNDISFPLPPLPEQHHIVAKIEELFTRLDAGVAALHTIKLQLKRYRQSVLKAAFEGKLTAEWRAPNKNKLEPASKLLENIKEEREKSLGANYQELPPLDTSMLPELPEGWRWTGVGDISEINPRLPLTVKEDSEVSFLPMKAVEAETGLFDLSIMKKYSEVKKGFTSFIDGDVIFAKITPCMENGKIAVMNKLKNGIGFGSTEFHVIRPFVGSSAKYIFYYLLQEKFRNDARVKMTGTAGQLRVPAVYLRKALIPLSSICEQEEIVKEVERFFSIADQIDRTVNQSLIQSDRLRQSILKQAFEGKLVLQDPTDEPADVLLERIKTEKVIQTNTGKKARSKANVQ